MCVSLTRLTIISTALAGTASALCCKQGSFVSESPVGLLHPWAALGWGNILITQQRWHLPFWFDNNWSTRRRNSSFYLLFTKTVLCFFPTLVNVCEMICGLGDLQMILRILQESQKLRLSLVLVLYGLLAYFLINQTACVPPLRLSILHLEEQLVCCKGVWHYISLFFNCQFLSRFLSSLKYLLCLRSWTHSVNGVLKCDFNLCRTRKTIIVASAQTVLFMCILSRFWNVLFIKPSR